MINSLFGAAILALLNTFVVAHAQTLEDFAKLPTFKSIEVSPEATRILANMYDPKKAAYRLIIFDRADDGGLNLLYGIVADEKYEIQNPTWVRDDRLVYGVRFKGKRFGTDTVETRLISLDPVTGESIGPFGNRNTYRDEIPVQFQDQILSVLPGEPEHIMLQYFTESGHGVYKVNVDGVRRHRTIRAPRDDIQSWMTDVDGTVRAGWGIHSNNKKQSLIVLDSNGKWKYIADRVNTPGLRFRILGFGKDPNTLFVASNHEGDVDALYEYDVATDSFAEKIYISDSSDIFGIYQDTDTGEVLGVTSADEDVEVDWLEGSNIAAMESKLAKALGGDNVQVLSLNRAKTHAVVFADSGNRPGGYYIFDIKNKSLEQQPSQYPGLDNVPLGEVIATSYKARDGLDIPAFVTLPVGITSLDQAKNLPFVIHPHGGPSARDFAGFDWVTQYFVSKGYGVLQMNFRGSSGYGTEFEDLGDKQWGQAMQDDVSDGVKWLVESGYADQDRIAIMGFSYGGYAALMGAAKTPDLYKCAISHGGVTDLPDLISHKSDFVGGKYRTRHIGRLWKDREMLRDNSPARIADQFGIPVMLMHGEEDRVVPHDQARKMARALKRADKEHKFVTLEEGSHYLDVGDNRLTFLKEMVSFLDGCLGN